MTGPPAKPPALSRAALERVLARAAELQAQAGDDEAGLSEAQLVEIAGEVGLSSANVRQAIAEVRAHVDLPDASGLAHRLLGGAVAEAVRLVPGSAAASLATVDAWMQRSESLQVKRRFPDQMSWEPRQDFVAAIRRALRVGGRGFHLASATEVRVVVVAVEGNRSHVRLVADYSGTRAQRATAALIGAGAGIVVGVPAFWLATSSGLMIAAALSLVPALVVPALAVSLVRRAFRRLMTRAQVALEQALDRLEYTDTRPGG
ncbi:MAG TPA: hypothetical protein VG916_08555 [Gemmatimonadaceae bacterium]|nr:hypothetical protein [Gemmatimonadaceae bacterium]